jgi:hypothetical protein
MTAIAIALIAFTAGGVLGALAVAFGANARRREERGREQKVARALAELCVENGVDKHLVHMQGLDPGWRPRMAASAVPLRPAMYATPPSPPPPRDPGRGRNGGAYR